MSENAPVSDVTPVTPATESESTEASADDFDKEFPPADDPNVADNIEQAVSDAELEAAINNAENEKAAWENLRQAASRVRISRPGSWALPW